jgi:hypothetical protein
MASEIRVNKIINRSGLSTVTFSDTGAIVSGIVTANSFSGNVTGNVTGSGANLTSIPAGQLTGTVADARLTSVTASKLSGALPAIDGSSLTGINTAFGSGTSVNTSGIITATAFVPTTGQLSHRNIIVNGAMTVAQRGTSHGSSGFRTVDRFAFYGSGLNASVTTEQADVASGTTPYTSGFRKSHKITNGAQTGPDAGDYIYFSHKLEAQDIATSGWNYTSASSYVTLSFWVKSSVAQNFYGYLKTGDGTAQNYPFETGSLSANTWTKVTKTIPGNSNLQFDINTDMGIEIVIAPFFGTDKTGTLSLNAWGAWSSSNRLPDNTSTWFTTSGATFEYTGVQLEVGPVATPFEHRSYGEELLRCQRYCYADRGSDDYHAVAQGHFNGSSTAITMLYTPVCMRAAPTLSYPVGTWIVSGDAGTLNQSNIYPTDNIGGVNAFQIRAAVSGAQSGEGFLLRTSSAGHTWILDAEL